MSNNIKAAIFDMDGTLVDSMWVWSKIDNDYLKKRHILVPPDLKDNIEHLTFEGTAKYFKERFNIKDDVEDILNEWHDMAYEEYKNNVPLKKGAKEFLNSLKTNGLKIGLATSNSPLLIEAVLKNNNVYDYFHCITVTDEVKKGKNFPDVYLLTAQKLNVSPEKCVVFEDILPAVKGAKAAGMKVVAVEDSYSIHQKENLRKEADKYISSYEKISINSLI